MNFNSSTTVIRVAESPALSRSEITGGAGKGRYSWLKMKNQPERTLLGAFRIDGSAPWVLTRPLRAQERLLLAVYPTAPTHLLTIDSVEQNRAEFVDRWRRLVKRINRSKQRSRKPLIYVGSVAKSSSGGGGYHLHALLWKYLHLPVLIGDTRDVGLGKPDIQQIVSPHRNAFDVFSATAYVLAQHQPVFGTDHHLRHEPLPPYARRYLIPQRRTLKDHHSDLLSAMDRAFDRPVTDDALVRAVPRFSYKGPRLERR